MKTFLTTLTALILALTFPSVTVAQILEWDQTFGGTSSDVGRSVQQTEDGGYIIAGGTHSYGAGAYDVWLIKTDSNGTKDWDQTFGGEADDIGWSVQQTTDGGYIITGYTRSYGTGGGDVWLIKTDSLGNKDWDQTFGGGSYDVGQSVQQTEDGGYIIVGFTYSYGAGSMDVWLIKVDADGNYEWDQTFGGASGDGGWSVQQTDPDGGYIISGYTYSYGAGNADVWLVKTDANGNKKWDRTFGGPNEDSGLSVQQAADGVYIIAGRTYSYGEGGSDVWLIETDARGNKQWDQTFGGEHYDQGRSVWQTARGGYIVVGETESYGAGGFDVWLIRTSDPLNQINLATPPDQSILTSPPEFAWTTNGGTNNAFAVDLAIPPFLPFFSSYENLRKVIYENSWTMPTWLWNVIPSGSRVYWRVRGVDLDHKPRVIITSDEVWSFYKQ